MSSFKTSRTTSPTAYPGHPSSRLDVRAESNRDRHEEHEHGHMFRRELEISKGRGVPMEKHYRSDGLCHGCNGCSRNRRHCPAGTEVTGQARKSSEELGFVLRLDQPQLR